MKTKLLLINCLIGGASLMIGQTTLNIKVATALDDHMERIAGANPQSGGSVGDMIVSSPVLDFGNETSTTNPRLVGLRFTGLTIPKFATIMDAYVQFTVKGTSKNTDPCTLNIYAEDNVNPATFSDNANSLSGRTMTQGFVAWTVSGTTWGTVGSAGTEQRTPSIKSLIQPLIFKSTWVSGNPVAVYIKGSGVREVESFEGSAAKAAELVVTYSVAGGTSTVTTGVEELNSNSSVSVYPNPFNHALGFNVNIEVAQASDISIAVYDLTGKLIDEKIVKQAAAGIFHYTSASELKTGMYFVKVQANGKQEIIKLIAQ